MEILSQEALKSLHYKSGALAHPTIEEFYTRVSSLEEGYAVLVKKEEWPAKTLPNASYIPNRLKELSKKFSVRSLKDGSAFVVQRTQ